MFGSQVDSYQTTMQKKLYCWYMKLEDKEMKSKIFFIFVVVIDLMKQICLLLYFVEELGIFIFSSISFNMPHSKTYVQTVCQYQIVTKRIRTRSRQFFTQLLLLVSMAYCSHLVHTAQIERDICRQIGCLSRTIKIV